jgi:BNR repeat-like domain
MTLAPALWLVVAASFPAPVQFAGGQPQLAAVGQRVGLVFGEGQTIYFAGSRDGGRTFSSPVAVPSHGSLALGRHRGPRVAIVGDAVVVTAILAAERGSGDLFAWRSTDDGRSWFAPVRLNGVVASAREGLHGMGGAGTLVTAAWLDLRAPGTHLRAAVSNDAGATWSEDRLVYESPSGTICQCCHPSVVVSPLGDISVMFRNALDGSRDLYLTTSHDGGRTFEPATKLGHGAWKLDACPMDGGALAVDERGVVGTVWRREKEVFFARPGQPEQPIGLGGDPAIAFGRNGALSVIFRDDEGVSLSDGSSPATRIVAPGAQTPVLLALGDGSLLVAWERDKRVFVERVNAPTTVGGSFPSRIGNAP